MDGMFDKINRFGFMKSCSDGKTKETGVSPIGLIHLCTRELKEASQYHPSFGQNPSMLENRDPNWPVCEENINHLGGDKKKNQAAAVNHAKLGGAEEKKKMDKDIMLFIQGALELKGEGNIEFQNKNYVGAMEQYERALKLLPTNHMERIYLHGNRAACLMKIEPVDYESVVKEYTLALEVNPRYKKALLRRAKAYETLGKLDLALEDVQAVLQEDPNDKGALGIGKRLNMNCEAAKEDDDARKALVEDKVVLEIVKRENTDMDTHQALGPVVPGETRRLKLIYDQDIRIAEMPLNCGLAQLREIARKRYPTAGAFLIKYRDLEGDLVTITSTEELRCAEAGADVHDYLRLYLAEVDPKQEPLEEGDVTTCREKTGQDIKVGNGDSKGVAGNVVEMDEWVLEFAHLFTTQLGIDPAVHMDLRKMGIELFTEALEESITCEDAQCLFEMAACKFKEAVALGLFNWGNVYMCAARRSIQVEENSPKELVMAQVLSAYEWAQRQLLEAGQKYEEALTIMPDFYEGLIALGQQQFESAKLSWSLALASNADLETWDSTEMLWLFNSAEEKMQKGAEIWERLEKQRLNDLKNPSVNLKKGQMLLKKKGLNGRAHEEGVSAEEAAEFAAVMRSQINLLWGNMLFEHSHVEFKLGSPMWEGHLDAAVKKFKLAGASSTDVAVVLKNHSSNASSQRGLGFEIDEIVQAWNEMREAKRWLNKSSSFRLEPLFRRKVPKLHEIFEHVQTLWH